MNENYVRRLGLFTKWWHGIINLKQFVIAKTITNCLEHVEISMLRRKQENFVSGKANFAVGCGRSGEKFNEGLK